MKSTCYVWVKFVHRSRCILPALQVALYHTEVTYCAVRRKLPRYLMGGRAGGTVCGPAAAPPFVRRHHDVTTRRRSTAFVAETSHATRQFSRRFITRCLDCQCEAGLKTSVWLFAFWGVLFLKTGHRSQAGLRVCWGLKLPGPRADFC